MAMVRIVAGAGSHRAERICLPAQPMGQGLAIGYVRRRGVRRVRELGAAVDAHVCCHPEVPLSALGGLIHLRIPLTVLVIRRTRGTEGGYIDDRAVTDLDPIVGQIPDHRREQLLAELVQLDRVAELVHRGLIGRSLAYRGRCLRSCISPPGHTAPPSQ